MTHKVFLHVADRCFYRPLEINGKDYGLYYIAGADLEDVTLRGLLYNDTYHLELVRRVVTTWQGNFSRELDKMRSKPSSEQDKISDNQMVVENVTGYRKIFRLNDEYWKRVKEVQDERQAA